MLPKELIFMIFKDYEIVRLHQLQTVCRLWNKWIQLVPELFHFKYRRCRFAFKLNDYSMERVLVYIGPMSKRSGCIGDCNGYTVKTLGGFYI